MNAPPKIDPITAHSDSDVVHWLTNDTRDERFIDNIFAELCVRLQRAGIPVKRGDVSCADPPSASRPVRARLQYPDLRRKVASLAGRYGAENILIEDAGARA
jgi:hypothetical protein